MRRVFVVWIVGLAILVCGCATTPGAKDANGWQPLFNGRNLDGWTVKCKPADKEKTFWKVDNGTILADSMGDKTHDYIWLTTHQQYTNFALRLKFQAYRGNPGNSGVQIRSRYDDAAGWLDGPQIDINPPGPWRTGMMWDETRGMQRWIFPDVPKGKWVDEKMANPNLKFFYSDEGQGWNDFEVSVIGLRVKAVLNGVPVTNFDGRGILDDDLHKQRNVGQRGVIALQIHIHDELKIRFKDIRVKDLAE